MVTLKPLNKKQDILAVIAHYHKFDLNCTIMLKNYLDVIYFSKTLYY